MLLIAEQETVSPARPTGSHGSSCTVGTGSLFTGRIRASSVPDRLRVRGQMDGPVTRDLHSGTGGIPDRQRGYHHGRDRDDLIYREELPQRLVRRNTQAAQ